MKQKDIALIAVLAIVSGVAALLLSQMVFSSKTDKQQKAEVVDVISSDFPDPPNRYFNPGALNPTTLIQIGDNNNPNPFKDKQ